MVGIIKGTANLQLGGEQGITLSVKKGDVLVIPAGVAHMNLGNKYDVICIGGYPEGRDYDIKLGKPEERTVANKNIARVPLPATDPITGTAHGVPEIWELINKAHPATHGPKPKQQKRRPTGSSKT